MLNEYRRRFSQYHTEIIREDFLFRSGRKERRATTHIYAEYSDLFTLSAVEDLRGRLEETADYLETEQSSIRRLIAFALEGHLAASFETTAEGARDLGYENYLAMVRELRGIDYEKLASQVIRILSKSEDGYLSAIAPMLARETGTSLDEAGIADLVSLEGFTRFDHFFTSERLLESRREFLAGLGLKPEKQSNIEIDSEFRPRGQSWAFCSPINIPDEIKLGFRLKGGQQNYREVLRESGHAQNFAWTSRDLYPEFRIGCDAALPEAWGLLFENMMIDRQWLMGAFGFVESDQFRRALAVLRLMAVRRHAALISYEVELHAGRLKNTAASHHAERRAEQISHALRVRYDGTEYLSDHKDSFYSAGFLRAAAFESQLRDYLKTKFGLRWWISHRAGDMLTDLWNTGQRYNVEELAAMIGLGELNFDWLAEDLLGQIEG